MELISKKAKASIYLDTRRVKDDGLYPVKLRVYYGKAKLFDTGISLTEEDFERSYMSAKPKAEYKDLKITIASVEAKANSVLNDLKTFTFEKFEKSLFAIPSSNGNIIDLYNDYINTLEAKEQIGTASSYRCSIASIKAFVNVNRKYQFNKISFESIDADFLERYEQWMISNDNSKTTVGIYLRALRSIFNKAIKDGIIDQGIYPFKDYKIPTGKNLKKALEDYDLKELFTVDVPVGSHMEKARDFWFFSYQCNGMNFRDIAELKFKNFNDTFFSFLRYKTRNTTKADPTPIHVPITPFVASFIRKYGNKTQSPKDYVFPILNASMTAKERQRANANFIRYVNQHMKKIIKLLGWNISLGTMVARHSFTTQVTRAMGLEFAQEALGHTTLVTTQNYWKGFENSAKKAMADKLMDFNAA